jgi:hypothetical protein
VLSIVLPEWVTVDITVFVEKFLPSIVWFGFYNYLSINMASMSILFLPGEIYGPPNEDYDYAP